MDAKAKKAWVKALKSGKYEQGRMALRSHDDRFCCLGVLCDINGIECRKAEDMMSYVYFFDHDGYLNEKWNFPDIRFLESLDIKAKEASCLAEMNDNGQTFQEIAKYIKKEL